MHDNHIRQTRIDHLTAIIANPRTTAVRRRAAERMMARLRGHGTLKTIADGRAYGINCNYDQKVTTTAIAELIRTDIRLARKVARSIGGQESTDLIGDAPADLRYTVHTKHYAGGSSITVLLTSIPADWGWTRHPHTGEPEVSPHLSALLVAVKSLIDSYNHDGSDPITDHCDVRFHGFVEFDEPDPIRQYWHNRAWGTSTQRSAMP